MFALLDADVIVNTRKRFRSFLFVDLPSFSVESEIVDFEMAISDSDDYFRIDSPPVIPLKPQIENFAIAEQYNTFLHGTVESKDFYTDIKGYDIILLMHEHVK